MSVEQASFLAQIISAIAIVASLIFVGFQLKRGGAGGAKFVIAGALGHLFALLTA